MSVPLSDAATRRGCRRRRRRSPPAPRARRRRAGEIPSVRPSGSSLRESTGHGPAGPPGRHSAGGHPASAGYESSDADEYPRGHAAASLGLFLLLGPVACSNVSGSSGQSTPEPAARTRRGTTPGAMTGATTTPAAAASPRDTDGVIGGCYAFDLAVDDTGFTPIILKAQNLGQVTLHADQQRDPAPRLRRRLPADTQRPGLSSAVVLSRRGEPGPARARRQRDDHLRDAQPGRHLHVPLRRRRGLRAGSRRRSDRAVGSVRDPVSRSLQAGSPARGSPPRSRSRPRQLARRSSPPSRSPHRCRARRRAPPRWRSRSRSSS